MGRRSGGLIPTAALLLLLLHLPGRGVEGFGSMSTLATLWGGLPSAHSFSICSIEAGSGHSRCWGTFSVSNSSQPSAGISLWALSGGAYFSCGLLRESHTAVCWGEPPGSNLPDSLANTSFSLINCGGRHACAIRNSSSGDEGRVDCWGDDSFGQATPPASIPMRALSAGDYFTCAITRFTGRVLCWGHIADSSLDVNRQHYYASISAGRTHICGILNDTREALCWGANEHGQANPPAGVAFSALAAGTSHTCGIRLSDHGVQCWGDDSLGQGRPPSGGGPFSLISAGDHYTCGLRGSGEEKLECWGNHVVLPAAGLGWCNDNDTEVCPLGEFERVMAMDGGDKCKICSACDMCSETGVGEKFCAKVCPKSPNRGGGKTQAPPPPVPKTSGAAAGLCLPMMIFVVVLFVTS